MRAGAASSLTRDIARDQLAKQTSRRELQKIDSQRLGSLLAETTEELGLLAGAFVEIQRKINQG